MFWLWFCRGTKVTLGLCFLTLGTAILNLPAGAIHPLVVALACVLSIVMGLCLLAGAMFCRRAF